MNISYDKVFSSLDAIEIKLEVNEATEDESQYFHFNHPDEVRRSQVSGIQTNWSHLHEKIYPI